MKRLLLILGVLHGLAVIAVGQTFTTKSGAADVTVSPGSGMAVFAGNLTASTFWGKTMYSPPGSSASTATSLGPSKTVRFTGLKRYSPIPYSSPTAVVQPSAGQAIVWPVSLVSIVDPGPIVAISASQPNAFVGNSVTITATFTQTVDALTATTIYQNGSPIPSLGSGPASTVSFNFVPTATGLYTFTAYAATTGIPLQDYASTTVFVTTGGTVGKPLGTISASPATISMTGSSVISASFWADTLNGDALADTSIESTSLIVPNPLPANQANRTYTFVPPAPGSYIFDAYADSISFPTKTSCASCKVIVATVSGLSAWITATPTSGNAPLNASLTWGSTNATAVSVSGPGFSSTAPSSPGPVALSNLTAGTYTYTITAIFAGSTVTDSATINVSNSLYTLATSAVGPGVVTPGGSYSPGTPVTLTATPNSGQRFTGWTGTTGLSAGDPGLLMPTLTVSMTQDRSIFATFAAKLSQVITFNPSPTLEIASATSLTLSASSSSGLPVTLTVVSGPATIVSGNVLVFSGPGIVVVRASQAGDATYAAAAPVDQAIRGLLRTLKVSAGSKESVNKGQGSASEQNPNQIITVP